VSGDGQIRIVELDRRAPSFSHLRDQATRKYKGSVQQFVYQLPAGSRIALNSDADLSRAIKESVGARQHDVRIEVQVAGGRAVGAANTTAAATPAATHTAPPAAYQAPSQPAQQHAAPAAAPVASGAAVISYTLPGRAGGADKVKVAAAQQADSYHFIPEAAGLDTLIEVELPNSKALVFKLTCSSGKVKYYRLPY
jgi:hypothetical protein